MVSHAGPSCRHPCPSSCPPLGPGQCSLRQATCLGCGGHCQALPVCGTTWPCGSGWAAPWEAASFGGMAEEEGRTCWAVKGTVQNGMQDGGCPLPGMRAGCSCRSRCWSPGASSSAEDELAVRCLKDHR